MSMRYLVGFSVLFVLLLPHNVFVACGTDGLTVVYVNGIFTSTKILADQDREILMDVYWILYRKDRSVYYRLQSLASRRRRRSLIEPASQLLGSSINNYDRDNVILLQSAIQK